MPLNFTPANAAPSEAAPGVAPAAKYQPSRTSPSMSGSQLPIPGQPEAAPAAAPAQEVEAGQEGQEGQQDPDLAWRLSVVARKDRAARERTEAARAAEARAKEAMARIEAREQALRAKEEKEALFRSNPAALLREYGFVPEAALQFMLNKEQLTPEQQIAATMEQKLAEERRARESEMQRIREEQEQREAERQAEAARRQEQEYSQQEKIALQELHADISDIVAQDPAFRLVKKAGERGVFAIRDRLNQISDEAYQQTGRRPPITTKLLERVAREVEQAAQAELRDTLTSDPELAAELGLGGRPVQRPTTLTNSLRQPPPPAPSQQRQETENEKRERVKAQLDALFRAQQGRR